MGDTRPRGLEARYYLDAEIFERELDRIFARSWQLVGHRSQVASPGQLITAQVGDERVIVANDGGAVRGFYNVCQHRGHELVSDDAASVSRITCPYHAWSYSLGGELVNARGEDVGQLCIPQVRVATIAGFLFVNLDLDAPTLEETIPGIEDELLAIAPDAAERVLSSRRTHVIDANWKVAVENYNECYHCPNVHKAFTAGVVAPASYRIESRGFTIHHTAQAPAPERLGYRLDVDAPDYGSFFTWPVSSIQCYPGRVLNTFRWVPLSVDRTLLIREWWFDRLDPTPEQKAMIELDWNTTVAEDFAIMDSVQRGIASRGYRPGPLILDPSGVATVRSENTVAHLHVLLRNTLGEA